MLVHRRRDPIRQNTPTTIDVPLLEVLSPVSIQTQSLALASSQSCMVATASTEHSYWLALAYVA